MAGITQSSDLEGSATPLDEENRQILSALNIIQQAVKDGAGASESMAYLQELVTAVEQSFELQDEIILRDGLEGWETHADQHERIAMKLMELAWQLSTGTANLTQATLAPISALILDHIRGADRELARASGGSRG